ncbi:MAG: DUF4382 domain-containing protein [archaeon]|nr:MAG: DUF4382 domain-containing protein [archaeon]
MRSTITVAVLVLIVAAVAGAGYLLSNRSMGTLAVGVTDSPIPSNVTHIFLTITNIVLQGESNSTVTFAVNATTFDLLKLNNITKMLGSQSVPAGNYTMIRFNVTSAIATIAGSNVTLNVPSGQVKVPLTTQKLVVKPGEKTTIVLDITPVMTNVSASYNLRPVVTVKSVSGPS